MTRCVSAFIAFVICSSAIAERGGPDPCEKVAFRAVLSYSLRDNMTLKDALEDPFHGYQQADSKKALWIPTLHPSNKTKHATPSCCVDPHSAIINL